MATTDTTTTPPATAALPSVTVALPEPAPGPMMGCRLLDYDTTPEAVALRESVEEAIREYRVLAQYAKDDPALGEAAETYRQASLRVDAAILAHAAAERAAGRAEGEADALRRVDAAVIAALASDPDYCVGVMVTQYREPARWIVEGIPCGGGIRGEAATPTAAILAAAAALDAATGCDACRDWQPVTIPGAATARCEKCGRDMLAKDAATGEGDGDLRTPAEWDKAEGDGMRIYDPDGWRLPDSPPWAKPITRAEFRERRLLCTMVPASEVNDG